MAGPWVPATSPNHSRVSVGGSRSESQPQIMTQQGQCLGRGGGWIIPESFSCAISMGGKRIWETQRHSIILNSSLSYPAHSQRERASKSAFILRRGSIRNHSCTDFWPASGCLFFFFLKTFPLLPAAHCFITLDKFAVLKSPHKCCVNCSILSGSSPSLVPDSHHVFILQSLFIFIFMRFPS